MLLDSGEVSAADFDKGLDYKFWHQRTRTLSMRIPGGVYDQKKTSKREVKIDAVERAIGATDGIDKPGPSVSEVAANPARLRAILKRLEQVSENVPDPNSTLFIDKPFY